MSDYQEELIAYVIKNSNMNREKAIAYCKMYIKTWGRK